MLQPLGPLRPPGCDKITFVQGGFFMFRQYRLLIAALLLATPVSLFAQESAPKMRRPGGGAGMDYRDYDAATLERGKSAFVANCGFCHGANAKGGESGPDLI